MSTYRELRERVCRANLGLVEAGLVVLTWGNASGADRERGVMAIKPSGVDYARLGPDDIVVLSLESGDVVEGAGRPSSDTPTHLRLYSAFPEIGGVVHTHSASATVFAQAMRPIPCLGTTHADTFFGEVPVTRCMTDAEIGGAYEASTGDVIIECFEERGLSPSHVPGCLVACHGPFAWGTSVEKALENAIVLEAVARMALDTIRLNPDVAPIGKALLDRHFLRKHGPGAYYGQESPPAG